MCNLHLQARYEMLRSSLLELARVGIISECLPSLDPKCVIHYAVWWQMCLLSMCCRCCSAPVGATALLAIVSAMVHTWTDWHTLTRSAAGAMRAMSHSRAAVQLNQILPDTCCSCVLAMAQVPMWAMSRWSRHCGSTGSCRWAKPKTA